jgi:hypothetical protein
MGGEDGAGGRGAGAISPHLRRQLRKGCGEIMQKEVDWSSEWWCFRQTELMRLNPSAGMRGGFFI